MELEGSGKNSLGPSPKPQTFIRPKNRGRLRNPYAASTPSTISSSNIAIAVAAALPGQASSRNVFSQSAEMNKVRDTSCSSTVSVDHAGMIVDLTIQQKKKHAIAHAQQDECTGNFKSFDSPHGNFLLPVIPTLVDLNRWRVNLFTRPDPPVKSQSKPISNFVFVSCLGCVTFWVYFFRSLYELDYGKGMHSGVLYFLRTI